MRTSPLMLLVITFVSCGGCASGFEETHYFRSKTRDARGIPVNYFRLQVTGGTMLSSSRYVSGYFDEAALDTYFNEFSQPDKGQIVAKDSSPPAASPAPASDGAIPVAVKT